MDLNEALERFYGASALELAKVPVVSWERPGAWAVRDLLLQYYPDEECRRHGYGHYPFARIAAVCPVLRPLPDLVRAITVSPASPGVPSLPLELLANYLWPLRGSSLWDSETYRLTAFDRDQCQAAFGVESFLRFRLTSGLMREELHFAVSKGRYVLPLREQIAPNAESMLDLSARSVCGGVHTLCAFARPAPFDDFAILVQRRSTRVGVAGGSYGVIPMAFHQPSESGHLDPREPATTALREIFEELFGGVESPAEAKFLTHPAIEWLLAHGSDLHFETTNLFLGLLGGNYDFSLLLAVTSTDFWETFGSDLQTGWESGEHFVLSSLDKSMLPKLLREWEWEDQALGCCLDGLRRLQAIDPKRTWREPYESAAR